MSGGAEVAARYLRLSGDVLLVGSPGGIDVLVRAAQGAAWDAPRPVWRWHARLPAPRTALGEPGPVDDEAMGAAARGWLAARRAARSAPHPLAPARSGGTR